MCTDFGAKLVELDGEGDDVHKLVADLRLDAIAQMVTYPGRVGSSVAPAQPGRIHREHRWLPSYIAASAGAPRLEALRQYLASNAPQPAGAHPPSTAGLAAGSSR